MREFTAHRYVLEREQTLARPIEEVFGFFEDAFNLESITPDFLRFRVLTPAPIEMAAGTRLEYKLRLFGLPVRWRTLISEYEPVHGFRDRQASGPFRLWDHRHTFEAVPGGTRVRDRVDYEMPFGPLGRLVHAVFIGRVVRRIFDYRAEQMQRRFAAA